MMPWSRSVQSGKLLGFLRVHGAEGDATAAVSPAHHCPVVPRAS